MHFNVMVFGDDVEQQMAPYQETNMGPIAPEYMDQVDVTDEVREQFHAPQRYWRLADGRYVNFGEAHERDAYGKFVLASGATMVDMSADEARNRGLGYATLDDAAEDRGATREGDRFFIEDNFNSRWDSWKIGGRWGSMLELLPDRQGFTSVPTEFDPQFAKIFGRSPPMAWEPTPGRCDQALKGDIDWAGMRAAARAKASAEWHLVRSWTGGMTWSSWKDVSTRWSRERAREFYDAQPAIKAIHEAHQLLPSEQRRWSIDDAWSGTHDNFVDAMEASAFVPFAVLFKGEWLDADYENFLGEAADPAWISQFNTIFDRVSDDAMVTILDCHT